MGYRKWKQSRFVKTLEGGKMKTLCWQCGKQAPVNESGICEDCWVKYAHLRENKKGMRYQE